MANAAIEIAETIQTASLKRSPSPEHDINPSTAASRREPLTTFHTSPGDNGSPPHVRPRPRRSGLPPIPDLRFEQSYLASIRDADTTQKVLWITVRDQVFLPLVQGALWNLALQGWTHWNRRASYSGKTVGSRIRRWWYGVNNWKIPGERPRPAKQPDLAAEVETFYTAQFGSTGGD